MAEPERLMELDLDFHRALAAASRNPVFALIVGAFQGICRQTWPIGWKSRTTPAARETMIATHEEIARLSPPEIRRRAVTAMAVHFDESVRALAFRRDLLRDR